jgi:hypothetical protein
MERFDRWMLVFALVGLVGFVATDVGAGGPMTGLATPALQPNPGPPHQFPCQLGRAAGPGGGDAVGPRRARQQSGARRGKAWRLRRNRAIPAPSASLPMDAQFETEESFWSATGEDAVPNRTITLNDSECREVAAALELMIDHCDAFAANGPADPFSVRRQNCQALLRKLCSAKS